MKRIILHIGQSKTGTSAIQDYFAGKLDAGTQIHYPRTGRQGTAHHRIAAALLPADNRPNWVPVQKLEVLSAELERELSRSPHQTALLSSEIFFNNPHVEQVARFLAPYDVTIVALFRRQDLWLDSLLQHQLKVLETNLDPGAWLERLMKSPAIDYSRKISNWERVFGKPAIRIDTFEPASMRRSLGSVFCKLCGIVEDPDVEFHSANEKACRDAVAVLQFLHFEAGIAKERVMALRRPLEEFSRLYPDPMPWKHAFSPAERSRILAHCQEQNADLCENYFSGQRDTLFLDNAVDPLFETYPGLTSDRSEKIINHLALRGADAEILEHLHARFAASGHRRTDDAPALPRQ